MTPNEQFAISYYLGRNLTKDAAVGITSVLVCESDLHTGSQGVQASETPGALNPSGAYGIASWNGPRQAALKAFADKYGLQVSYLETQLHFVLTEAADSYKEFWTAIVSPASKYADVISVMVDTYEIPANKEAEISKAMGIAAGLYG